MINYNKNKLLNRCLDEYNTTFSHTLDTGDFISEDNRERIQLYIWKDMKKKLKQISKEDKRYQREQKKKARIKIRAQKTIKGQ